MTSVYTKVASIDFSISQEGAEELLDDEEEAAGEDAFSGGEAIVDDATEEDDPFRNKEDSMYEIEKLKTKTLLKIIVRES